MSKQQIIDLAAEVSQLREQADKGEDINTLFEFADKARLFEETWKAATGKKGVKPKRLTNPYTGTELRSSSFNKNIKSGDLYKTTFKELANKYNRDEFVTRLLRGFSDTAKDSIRKLITDNQDTIFDLVERYAEIQRIGIGEIERTLAAQAKAELPAEEVIRVPQKEPKEVVPELPEAPPSPIQRVREERVQEVFQELLREQVPPAAGIVERVQDVVARGIDIARIPYQDLMDNLARRVMRRDLLPAPVMQRQRGRGARDWKGWIWDALKTTLKYGGVPFITAILSYLWHTIMGNTPKNNQAAMEEILKDAGITPSGTIEDAMKIKAQIETLMAQGKDITSIMQEGEVPAQETEEVQGEAPTPAPTQEGEVIMDAEEFQRRVEARVFQNGNTQEVDRRQVEATQSEPQPPIQEAKREVPPLSRTREVPPLTREETQETDAQAIRKGHLETIVMEQLLQLKKEEEDRRIATLYTQNPDDYMSPSVPNPYERPMYSDEWVDIKRLQRLQTPEYTRQEKEIWARNYQTPYQMGEGTIDNSVKDIKNVVEQIAQLERRLRYDYATKGLPRDERQPAVNWGTPMQRMGVAPRSRHERWDAYLDVVRKYDMDRYHYRQRQNEPPHSKLINREAEFGLTKPTPDIPSQQKIYDELMNESASMSGDYLDIQNDMDYEYFRRRIRKH